VNELEGMINGLLSNPEEMKKLVEMAGKIIGPESQGSGAPADSQESQTTGGLNGILSKLGNFTGGQAEQGQKATPDLSALLSGLGGGGAGELIGTVQKLFGANGIQKIMSMGSALSEKNDKKELIEAIKPWLSEDRRSKLDRAMIFAKVMRVAGVAAVFKREA